MIVLLFAVLPQEMFINATPGEEITIPITIVGNEKILVEGSGYLDLKQEITVNNKQTINLNGKIKENTSLGEHTTYIYLIPDNNKLLVEAKTIKINANIIENNKKTKSYNIIRVTLIIALISLLFYLKKRSWFIHKA